MTITIIAALAKNRVIGYKGKLPWPKMKADLQRFRKLSLGKAVIMGSKTFQSLGRPLPKRLNIILTRKKNLKIKNCKIAHSIKEALQIAKKAGAKEVIIGGGASVYEQFLPLADKMYLTIIHAGFKGDAFFPKYSSREWEEIERSDYEPDEENPYSYSFITLVRKRAFNS